MSLLEVDNASVYYEDNFQALYDIKLKVEEGEIFACIGANGAGTSTLLRTISGVLVPREGRVLFDGEPIDYMASDRRVQLGISMVPEGRRVFPSLTVHENLQIGAYRNRKGPWTSSAISSVGGPVPGRASTWCWGRRPGRCCKDASTPRRTTSERWRIRSCGIAF